jgi:tetratricopeptide (TPR) repeat protein
VELIRLTSSEPRHRFSAPKKAEWDLEDFYCVLQIQPHDSWMAMRLAERLVALGRDREALKVLRALERMDSRFETLNALAQTEYALELLEDSFNHLHSALMVAPEDGDELFMAFKTLGNIHVRWGDWDSAEETFSKAHRLKPDSDILQVNFGSLQIQRQRFDLALEHFRCAVQLNSENDKAWVGLALCHRMKGDLELSWGNLEAAIQRNPLNETAMGLLLDWGVHEGRELQVHEYLKDFLVRGGWSEKLSLAFVYTSWRRGDVAVAQLELERLLAVNPSYEPAIKLQLQIRGPK